jgi:pimeloyl-ACP methyl ester carboxylesterase
MQLREALADAIRIADPEGRDPALKRMVVIGHSQGGLLARLMATDGDVGWLEELLGFPVENLHLSSEQDELVHRVFDFDPLPQVERLVFIATPQRGSYLTQSWLARWVATLVALPGDLVEFAGELRSQKEKLPRELRDRLPTAVDNMNADNPFLKRLDREPIDAHVTYHSIIAVRGDGPLAEGNDGVVEYASAHLDGAESEFVVKSGHSCQQHPLVIREVRRILLENLGESVNATSPP